MPEKYFNSMFTNEFFFPNVVLIQSCSDVTMAVMANPGGGRVGGCSQFPSVKSSEILIVC